MPEGKSAGKRRRPKEPSVWAKCVSTVTEAVPLVVALVVFYGVDWLAHRILAGMDAESSRPGRMGVRIADFVTFAALVLPKAVRVGNELVGLVFGVAETAAAGAHRVRHAWKTGERSGD